MTRGLIRIYGQKHLHFITCSTYRRQPTLTASRRDRVLEQLEIVRAERRFQINGYVIMPEHFHLLIGEPAVGDPSTVMQLLKQRTAAEFNQQDAHARTTAAAKFWQTRFYDFNVYTHKKRVEKLRYMHNNPVERGLAPTPAEWKWSSYAFYRAGTKGLVEIDPT